MSTATGLVTLRRAGTKRRRTVRALAAALSGATAVGYFLIGFGILSVLETDGGPSLLHLGLPAGLAFALGAFVLLAFDRRALWVVGAGFQLFAILVYLAVAPQRTPPFEVWGVLLEIA